MTATNHMLTGGVIAVAVKQPALVIPLAFASHFVLDALPHFGHTSGNVFEKGSHVFMKLSLLMDAAASIVVLVWLGTLNSRLPLLASIIAYTPDITWLPRLFKDIRGHTWQGNWFTRFHQRIQRYEYPWAVTVELIWFTGCVVLLRKLLYT